MMYWKKQQLRRMIAIGLVGGSFIAAHPVHASEALVGDGNVIIEAGESYDKVIGGSIDQGLDDVKVSVKGDVKNNLSGGSTAQTQDVAVKNVTIAISDNAQVEHIQGGGIAINDHNSTASNTNIQVSGNAVIKTINGGGGSEGGNAHVDHAVIRIDGGIIGDQYSFDAKEGNGISGGGYTYQGGKSSVDQAEIHIDGGQILGNVTGGGIAGDNGEVSVKDSTITISGTKLDSVVVIGGGIADGTNSKTTGNKATISISNSYVSPDNHITGGNWVKNGGFGNLDMAVIQIEKSDVGRVSGAGFVENANAKVGEVVMNIKDSFVNNELRLGGAAVGGQLDIGTTSLNFEKSTLNGTLFGGGYASKFGDDGTEYEKGGIVTTSQSNILITNSKLNGNVYGGGWTGENGIDQVKNVDIHFSNSDLGENFVYGGGKVESKTGVSSVERATISIESSKTDAGTIYGGTQVFNGGKGMVGTSTIHVADSEINDIKGGGFVDNGTIQIGTQYIALKNSTIINNIALAGIAVGDISKIEVEKANVSIDDKSIVKNSIFGGGLAANSSSYGINHEKGGTVTVGESMLNIDGAVKNSVYGGGKVVGNGISIVKNSKVYIMENANVNDIYGGGRTSKDEFKNLSGGINNVTDSEIYILGGIVNGNVYGGGEARQDDTANGINSARVENSKIHIAGGEIAKNVYAGGLENATVGNSIIDISGGKIKGDILRGNAEKALLNFSSGLNNSITESKIDGKISGFDAVIIKKNAKAILTGENVADEPVIQAKSLTIEEYGRLTIGKNMTIDLGGIETTFKLRAVRAAGGQLNLGGELLIPAGTTLELKNTNLISQDTGMVTVGVDNNGSVGKIGMTDSSFANNRLNLNIGLPLDQLEKKSAEEITKIIENTISKDLVENINIENGKNALYRYKKDGDGNIQGVKANNSYLGFYTGIRQANAYIAQNMIGNIHERNASLRSGIKSNDFWVNIRGGSTEIDNGYGKAETKNQYYQLGYDWDISSDDNKAVIGLYFSKINGDTTQYNIKSDMENAYDLGIYGMKEFNGGNYLGLVGRYGNIKNNAKIDDREVKWQDKGYALSAEFGKRIQQKSGWMLEPYMQLTYNHLSEEGLNIDENNHVSLEGTNLFDGRIGLRFIQQEKENHGNSIYGGISYLKGISGQFKMKSPQGAINIEEDNDVNTVELSIGINRQISKCSNIKFDVKKEFGDYNGWGLQGSLNVSF